MTRRAVTIVGACGAVYVELGERPELDQLRKCQRDQWDCSEHGAQLDWIRTDPDRLRIYAEQCDRYDEGDRGLDAEQGALL